MSKQSRLLYKNSLISYISCFLGGLPSYPLYPPIQQPVFRWQPAGAHNRSAVASSHQAVLWWDAATISAAVQSTLENPSILKKPKANPVQQPGRKVEI